jgi:predicted RNase H-like nuclease
MDRLLRRNPAAVGKVRESHPEVCFYALAGGTPMRYNKKRAEGFGERLRVLEPYKPRVFQWVKEAMDGFLRKEVARDDIMDALVLAVTAALSGGRLDLLPLTPPTDEMGLPMEIVYYRPGRAQ